MRAVVHSLHSIKFDVLAHIMQDVETLKMQSPFFGCRKEAKSVRVCVLIACTFPMMAKVDFGKEADVGENKAISHAAIKKIKSQRVCLSYL